MTNVHLHLPDDGFKNPPLNRSIIKLYAQKDTEFYKINGQEHLRYAIDGNSQRLLDVQEKSGVITFKKRFNYKGTLILT